MKPTNKDINGLKTLFKEIARNRLSPTKESLLKRNREQINYNLKLFGYESEEEFARENSFCVSCGCSLNEDNECPGCGGAFGW